MRSAQCASAPSHPFHVMPSRITRNSYRPRASYRTMVASEATSALAALSQLDSMSPSAEKLTRMDNKPNFSREVKLQWAGSRETTSTSGRGGTFFLTSLFIELKIPLLTLVISYKGAGVGGSTPVIKQLPLTRIEMYASFAGKCCSR